MGFYNQNESGKALSVKDEGITVDSNVSELDFTGSGVDATQVSAGIVEVDVSGGGGGGDVEGPASSTDNAVARFHLGTGKIIQDSGVIIDDSDNVSGVAKLTASDYQASSSSGAHIKNDSGTDVAIFGAGGGTGISLVGTANVGSGSSDYHQVAGGTGTITSTATGSSTNISINLVPKGTGTVQVSGVDVVSVSGTQTLSNKTLTSPVINVGSDAEGDVYYRNSGGAFTRLGIGTTGQVLSVSAGGIPEWTTASGGGAPVDAEYYVASSNGSLTHEIVVTGLGTVNGIMKGNGSGAISSATAGTDYVTPTGTETLSNKTLTSPVINVGSDATGDIYYRNSGGAFTRLGIGTNGQVLTLDSGLPTWQDASGGGITWGDSITGTSGTGLTLTVGTNSSSGTIAQEIIFNNTQTNAIVGISINCGTSNLEHAAYSATVLSGGFTSNGGGFVANNFSSATQSVGNYGIGFRYGRNYNTNSSYSTIGFYLINENNSGVGYNNGLRIDNNYTTLQTSTGGLGAGFHIRQNGVDGTALSVSGSPNINCSTHGMVNFVLHNTQSGASIIQKIDTGTSAQGHVGYLVYMRNASTSARGYKFDGSTTFTGTAIELSGTTSTANAFEFGSAFYTSSAPAGTTTQYINITISGTAYVLEAKSVA